MKIGILALQGAFREHRKVIESLGHTAVEVRKPEQLEGVDGIIIPGGESTTIGKLMIDYSLLEPIRHMAQAGTPIFGTCAGMVLLAKDIKGSDQPRLGLMDVSVVRNGFGRQVDSFEEDINIDALGEKPFRAVFIRAPYIESISPQVGILAQLDRDRVVLARQGNLLACAFHPELTDDKRIHKYFLQMVKESKE
ncbi:MAG: pyridoxal 5'-phosphate synthase glutaminase subunit PdxT [Thermoanaerobacteraceae bacterium]|nr:pyridoxal 5'-phosphate synthase glutaminase subunit PdxT [Thermoanaerobacteraceae bacterium]